MRQITCLLLSGLITGCIGNIGDPPPVIKVDACATAPAHGITLNRLRRLSSTELANTLGALLGPEIIVDAKVQAALTGLPSDRSQVAGDFTDDPPVGLAQALAQISAQASGLALASPTWRAANLPACAAADTPDDSCIAAILTSFGVKVLRRDPTDAEIADYTEFYHAMGAGKDGLGFVLRRLLQSPTLSFHVESGSDVVDGSIRLTDFEVASRISYFAANTMPDDELMAAARSGELQTIDGVRPHIMRMLDTPEGHAKVYDFFRYYTHLEEVPDPLQTQASLLGIADVTGLGKQMRDEAFDFFTNVFWNTGSFHDLMTSTDAFPRSAALATVFGTDPISDATPVVTALTHIGLLHRPALLTSPEERTSPIIRGAHVLKYFLCESLGTPPADLVSARQDELGDIDNMSNRDRITTLTDSSVCMGCHGAINQTGFTFEAFDQLGAPRSVETVLDSDGNVTASWPLDTDGATVIDGDNPQKFSSSQALANAIADSEIARDCVPQRMFEYYRASRVGDSDACVLGQAQAFSKSDPLQSMLVALIANDDIFWRKEP
jgi:hypothetical protein